jgi:sugar lactone lactonase YvrE
MEINGGDEPLTQIPDIALDKEGNLLVIDGNNDRIRVFSPEGDPLDTWGERGEEAGQFQFLATGPDVPPWCSGGLATDKNGHVYVADAHNCRIQKLGGDGAPVAEWGEYGTGQGQFLVAVGVAADSKGNTYVTDPARGDVQRFDSQGQFLTKWSNPSSINYGWLAPAVDEEDNVYVPCNSAAAVRKYSSTGELLLTFGRRGNGDGEFIQPVSVAVDPQGNVYVADKSRHCIQKFDDDGDFLVKLGSRGTGPGEFRDPTGIAVDADGTVYVAEWGGRRIQVFRQQ